MPELFDEGPADDAFALPSDEATLARMRDAHDAPPAPEVAPPAEPPEPAAPEAEAAPAAADDAAAATEEAAAELGITADDPRVQAYLAKFGGDPEKALRAAVEAESLIGRQGQELGELRALVEQRFETIEERQAAAQRPQYDSDALADWFTENPTRIPEIAAAAYYQGENTVLDAALVAWEDVDKPAARRFERQIAVAEARAELHREQSQQQHVAAGWNEVAGKFAEDHPDLEQVAPLMREIAPQYPHIVSVLETGTVEAKREVLEFLYEKASRGQETDTRALAREIARETEGGRQEAIEAAAVASATTTAPAVTAPVGERIAAEWDKADAPYRDGWNV